MSRLTIKDICDQASCRPVEDLQAVIWGFRERGVVPAHVLLTVGSRGGIVLGAYLDGELVGFVLGFLGRESGRLCHISHMLGVHPDYQDRGVGEALKLRQRERALEQGLDLMTWTFDPMEARNAYFNLHKLGAICRIYYENLYGDLGDRLNRGLPTDRLLVEWHLRDTGLHRPLPDIVPTPILESHEGKPKLDLDPSVLGAPLSVAIPEHIQRLKQEDPERALAWRRAQRRALGWGFERGYVARDVVGGAYYLTRE